MNFEMITVIMLLTSKDIFERRLQLANDIQLSDTVTSWSIGIYIESISNVATSKIVHHLLVYFFIYSVLKWAEATPWLLSF